MLGIIAWIRPDGHNALVVVSGSEKMASGDPGNQTGESLKVGDMVFMTGMSEDGSSFSSGLHLVRAGYWPRIVQDILRVGRANREHPVTESTNVVSLFANRAVPNVRQAVGALRPKKALLAAE